MHSLFKRNLIDSKELGWLHDFDMTIGMWDESEPGREFVFFVRRPRIAMERPYTQPVIKINGSCIENLCLLAARTQL